MLNYKNIQNKEREIFRVEISDAIHNSLSPGAIVAYSAGSKLKFGVYEGVVRSEFNTANSVKKIITYRVQICTAKGLKVRRTVVGSISYNKEKDEFSMPDSIIVVDNPLFRLGSDKIGACLQAIDILKEEGHLLADFKLT